MSEAFRTIVDETNQITTLIPTTHSLVLGSPSGENLSLQSGSGFTAIIDADGIDSFSYFNSIVNGTVGSSSRFALKEYPGVPGGDTFRFARITAEVTDRTVATWGTPGNTYDIGLHALNIGGTPSLALVTRKFDSSGAVQPGLPLSILSSGLRVRNESAAYTWYEIDDSSDVEFPDHDFQGTEYNFETPTGVAFKIEDDLVTADVPVKLPSYSVAALPTVVEGAMIYVADATGDSVTGSQCFGNSANWIDVTTGVPVV